MLRYYKWELITKSYNHLKLRRFSFYSFPFFQPLSRLNKNYILGKYKKRERERKKEKKIFFNILL